MKNTETFKRIFIKEQDPFKDIIGQTEVKNQIKSALLLNRHIVIYGPPGIGKTTTAKNIAKLLPTITVNNCDFNCVPDNPICPACKNGQTKKTKTSVGEQRFIRIQGSPDLTAEDLLGDIDPIKAIKFGSLSMEAFTPGKIFKANNGILFFDELNRSPEKLQNALLQVLEERKATIGSYDVDIDANFIFIATMNPQDSNTEKLSDVLLDRFDVIYMDYPESESIEEQIVSEKSKKLVEIPKDMKTLMVEFVRNLRANDNLEKVPSVRATIGLFERSQGSAYLRNKNKVEFQDVKNSIVSVLAHRIRLKPSLQYVEETEDYLTKEFEKFIDKDYSGKIPSDQGGDG